MLAIFSHSSHAEQVQPDNLFLSHGQYTESQDQTGLTHSKAFAFTMRSGISAVNGVS